MSLDFTKVVYVDGETVIGADNLNDIQDAILDLDSGLSGKYEKPSDGIPSSDLAQAVQTSLGKADTALQDADVDSVPTENSDNPVASGGVYTALAGKVNSSAVGAASGVASLDSSGKVPSSQLPPSTDSLPLTGGTMSGEINMGSNKITGLANGTNASDAVNKSQLDAAILGALVPSGSVAFASLPSLTAANLNHVYNVTDAFTTTSDFLEGAGKNYPAGTNVAIINTGTAENPVYKYDVYGSFIDLSAYRTSADQDVIDAGKLGTSGDGSNVTAVFTAASTRTNIATGEKLSVIFGKIAKWFADLGTAAFRAATSSISSGSTDLVESGAVYTALNDKVDKVQSATNGNFAALDANGNLTDSGHKNSDYAPSNAGIPSGGSTGQYLKKKSNTDYDTEWATGGGGTGDALPLAGGTMSGNINMDGNRVQNLPTPSANGDAAPKGYTDGIVSVSDTQPTASQNKLWVDTDGGSGASYQVPTVAEALALGIAGASVGDLVRVNAVDSNGKPTSWKHVPLCEIMTNPNLLDNWYFGNPVNQRGQSIYIATSKIYTIDRWDVTNATVAIQNGLLNVSTSGTSEVRQILDLSYSNLAGKEITASAIIDGELFEATGTVPSSKPSEFTIIATITKNNIVFRLGFSSASDAFMFQFRVESSGISYSVEAAKLELGSEQTLAHQENGAWVLNEIPNYNDELIKCRQYFIPIFGVFLVSEIATNNLYFKISIWPLQYLKRADPTVTWPNRSSSTTITNRNNALATGFTFGSVYYASAASTINVRYDKTSHGLSNAVLNIPVTEPIFISYDL